MKHFVRDDAERLQRLREAWTAVWEVARDPCLLPELGAQGDGQHADGLSVEQRCLAESCREDRVAYRGVHRADAQETIDAKGDRDREERYALGEIQASADGIDDPKPRGVNGQRLVLRPLLGEDRVAGAFLLED